MKLGVNLINFGPSASADVLRGWALLAEGLGYHAIMTSDHVTVTSDVNGRYPAPFYEPLTTLGWLAAITSRLEIGTTVSVLPYRSPLETARAFANVDNLSGGRVILGVGVGWAEQEFAALKVPFAERGAITTDYLAAIKALWSADIASYEGKYVTFKDVHTTPRPIRKPHPPIWVDMASPALDGARLSRPHGAGASPAGRRGRNASARARATHSTAHHGARSTGERANRRRRLPRADSFGPRGPRGIGLHPRVARYLPRLSRRRAGDPSHGVAHVHPGGRIHF